MGLPNPFATSGGTVAFINMVREIRGTVPKIAISYCKTIVNRAWADLRRQNLWSFQCYDSNWIAPPLVNTGTATAVQGSNLVTLNGVAAAAVNASLTTFNPINQRQFRVGISTVCNITAWDGASILTLDRGFPDAPAVTGNGYQIYQCYYPAPFQDHLSFVSVRDMVNFTDLILDQNMAWLNEQDPQRTWYYFPTHVVPFITGTDPNNTATYRFPIFELWGVPLTNRAYQLYGIRKFPDLVSNSDTLPPQVTEEAVIARAKVYAYEWAEANKGALPRNQGPDWKFLMGETQANYQSLYRKLRMQDREFIDNWFRVRRSSLYGKYYALYNTISQTAYPGAAI